ncbi:hypothetical protein [Micromonospora sp. NPDC002575]|uniref:hypothetical protein n=1 Tax=Micromonospora sp. NPDC002575 TaxID=3364222 RepID=UPI0036C4E741
MAILSELYAEARAMTRWLLRRPPEPPPPPGTGQAIQVAEQAAARRQLLGLAEAERVRRGRWCDEPTQIVPEVPMTPGQRARSEW